MGRSASPIQRVGSVMVKVVPFPTSLWTPICPRCILTMPYTMESPSPVPFPGGQTAVSLHQFGDGLGDDVPDRDGNHPRQQDADGRDQGDPLIEGVDQSQEGRLPRADVEAADHVAPVVPQGLVAGDVLLFDDKGAADVLPSLLQDDPAHRLGDAGPDSPSSRLVGHVGGDPQVAQEDGDGVYSGDRTAWTASSTVA